MARGLRDKKSLGASDIECLEESRTTRARIFRLVISPTVVQRERRCIEARLPVKIQMSLKIRSEADQ
ncbi:uncharacterized protein TNCV_4455171 [Trichonephila clavipes]|nr:uncharacterized protein TNCV_4455171 [Trichonephila clavipes]